MHAKSNHIYISHNKNTVKENTPMSDFRDIMLNPKCNIWSSNVDNQRVDSIRCVQLLHLLSTEDNTLTRWLTQNNLISSVQSHFSCYNHWVVIAPNANTCHQCKPMSRWYNLSCRDMTTVCSLSVFISAPRVRNCYFLHEAFSHNNRVFNKPYDHTIYIDSYTNCS